jgi:hypothetical protein
MIGKISDRIYLMQNEIHQVTPWRMSLEVQLGLASILSGRIQVLNDMGILVVRPPIVQGISMTAKDIERILFA